MGIFAQLTINGLIAGAIYALVAAGFSLIYSTNKFIHFAHGASIAFCGYFLYFLFSMLHVNFWVSVILAIIFAGLLGYGMDLIVYKQLRKRKASPLILLIASLGLLIFLESLIIVLFGADIKTIGYVRVAQGMEFLGAMITPLQVVIIIVSIILFILLFLFMKKSKMGKAMRAVANNKEVAEIVGISSERIYRWSFIIGSAIAGIAAILVGLEQNLEATMGTNLMIRGFTGSIVGGIGNVPSAIIGGFMIGFAENYGVWFLPSGYKEAIAFIILFVFLLFRPQGLFGIKKMVQK
jgi:branched-chain amino acid transport system permease protein